jgi:hypothetical protein
MKLYTLVLLIALYCTAVAARPNDFEDDRFVEESSHLSRPTIVASNVPVHASVPFPHTPEPLAAEPKKPSIVEQAGLKDPFEHDDIKNFRFRALSRATAGSKAEVEAKTETEVEAPMTSQYIDGDAGAAKMKALHEALQSVKDQIVAKASQIKSEKKWVKEVTKIIETYVVKTRRVNMNIRQLQKQVKELFRKKKQIDNLIVQRKLEKKLKVANKDLTTLQSALHNVKKKHDAFMKSKRDVTVTIGAIESELGKLKGQKPKGKKGKKKGKKKAGNKKAKKFF